MHASESTTSAMLRQLFLESAEEFFSLRDIVSRMQERGFALLLVLFALPMALPLPYPPGFSTLVSLPLLFISAQMALGYSAFWLPEFVAKKRVNRLSLQGVLNKALPYVEKLEHYLKPRHPALLTPLAERLIGAFALVLACCILLPLSFLSNTIPAAGITLMALGLMAHDGKCIIIGAFVGLIGFLITLAVLVLGAGVLVSVWNSAL